MKKTRTYILISFLIFVALLLIYVVAHTIYINYWTEVIKTEIYENDTETLTVLYERNGKTCKIFIDDTSKRSSFGFWVNFVNENTAVFDETGYSQHMMLVFHDGYIEYYGPFKSWGEETLTNTYYFKKVIEK